MKYIFFSLTALACFSASLYLLKQSPQDTPYTVPDGTFLEKPVDWMALQRAYPYGYIRQDSYIAAMKKATAMHREHPTKANWVFAGPENIGGRITDIEAAPGNPNIIYVGAATGGILKSTDNGATWQNIFAQTPYVSIGDLAVDPSDPNVIYAGTGEANSSSFSFMGGGIYKSLDAGATWFYSGLQNSAFIGRILVDPENSSRVFAAACGTLFSPNTERGIYRSLNGGATWTRVLFVTDSTAAIDLVQNPEHPDTLYAAMWERMRGLSYRRSAGASSGIYRSVDGGDSWTKLTNGLPAYDLGRIGLAIAPSNPNVVYAYMDDCVTVEVYRSNDAGNTWTACENTAIQGMNSYFGWYFGQVRVDPLDEDRVYLLGVDMFRTDDGGLSWNHIAGYFNFDEIHVDHHAMIFDASTGRILEGNDGGLYESFDYGDTWTKINNLPITQFYEIEIDYQLPERIYGGTQDNNSVGTQIGGLDDWWPFLGGDGFYCVVDYTDPNTFYMEYQYGMLHKTTDGGLYMEQINYPMQSDRTNWSSPLIMDPVDPYILYFGTHRVWKTTDGGYDWTPVSNDLTKGPDGSGWHTLTCLAVSVVNPSILMAGTDDGKVHVSTDAGSNWTDVSSGLPDRWITRVACDPIDQNTVYCTVSGFRWDDPTPHVLKSVNLGSSWTDISGNLPDLPVNAIVIDSVTQYIYIGTDAGIFATSDGGNNWEGISGNIGNVPVTTLKIHQPTRTLVAGTYGLSAWKLDLSSFILENSTLVHPESGKLLVYPVPFTPGVEDCNFILTGSELGIWFLEVYNQAGKLCAVKTSVLGTNVIRWNGCGPNGLPMPAGVYTCRARFGKNTFSKSLLIQ